MAVSPCRAHGFFKDLLLLGGSWVAINGVMSRVTIHIRGLIAPLITTNEPPSGPRKRPGPNFSPQPQSLQKQKFGESAVAASSEMALVCLATQEVFDHPTVLPHRIFALSRKQVYLRGCQAQWVIGILAGGGIDRIVLELHTFLDALLRLLRESTLEVSGGLQVEDDKLQLTATFWVLVRGLKLCYPAATIIRKPYCLL